MLRKVHILFYEKYQKYQQQIRQILISYSILRKFKKFFAPTAANLNNIYIKKNRITFLTDGQRKRFFFIKAKER